MEKKRFKWWELILGAVLVPIAVVVIPLISKKDTPQISLVPSVFSLGEEIKVIGLNSIAKKETILQIEWDKLRFSEGIDFSKGRDGVTILTFVPKEINKLMRDKELVKKGSHTFKLCFKDGTVSNELSVSVVEMSEVAKVTTPKVVTPKVEPKKELVKVVKKEPIPKPTSTPKATSKWITPTKSACINNDGKVQSDGSCKANWKDANRTCQAMGGRLPTIEELKKVVTQKNYKEQGFTSNGYWSSTTYVSDSSYAWGVSFYYGGDVWSSKTRERWTVT